MKPYVTRPYPPLVAVLLKDSVPITNNVITIDSDDVVTIDGDNVVAPD